MVLRAGMTEGLQETGLVTWPHLGGDSTVFGSATPVSLFHLGRRKTRQSLEQLGGRLSLVAWPSPRPGRSGLADDASEERTGLALLELMLFQDPLTPQRRSTDSGPSARTMT